MRFKKAIQGLVLACSIGISSCDSSPNIEQKADLTGDGVEDILVRNSGGIDNWAYLFIGQKEGGFIRAKKCQSSTANTTWYQTDDGRNYFFDGKNYVEAVKEVKSEDKK